MKYKYELPNNQKLADHVSYDGPAQEMGIRTR